jgi:hypothetical protein
MEATMARLDFEVLGKPTGTMGEYYARQLRGKTVVSHRPRKYRTPTDTASVARRTRFLTTVRFAKTVTSLPALKTIWNNLRGKYSSAHHAALHANYNLTSTGNLTPENLITPEGFNFIPSTLSFDWKIITVRLPVLNESVKPSDVETVLSLNIIIWFYEPVGENKSLSDLTAFSREFPAYDFSSEFGATIELKEDERERAARYAKSIFYLAVAITDASGRISQYSSTFSKLIG